MNDTPDSTAAPTPKSGVEVFTFGEPTPVLDLRGIFDYLECGSNGRYYEPPVELNGLSRTTRANPYLQTGLTFKRNMLVRTFKPSTLLSREAFAQLALDYVTFGTAYLERRKAVSGKAHS